MGSSSSNVELLSTVVNERSSLSMMNVSLSLSNEDIDGEGSSLSTVSFSVVGVGTLMLLVKLKLYVGVRRTLIVGIVDGIRDGIVDVLRCDCDDEFDEESDGGNVSVARGVEGG